MDSVLAVAYNCDNRASGTGRWHRHPRRADCTILLDPVAFLLIALGRLNPWRAIAQGWVLAWGPRPWLAPRFPSLFTAP